MCSAKRRMKEWTISASWCPLSDRVRLATTQVHMVCTLPRGFLRLVSLTARSISMLVCMGLKVLRSGRNLHSIRSGIVRACWPKNLPIAHPHAVLS